MQIREDFKPKLLPRYIGPYPITKVISHMAYKSQLPPTMECHDVFYSSLLKPAYCFDEELPDRIQPEPPSEFVQESQAYFMVEKILSRHPSSACSHAQTSIYAMKRAGWPMHKTTYEPAINIMADVPQQANA